MVTVVRVAAIMRWPFNFFGLVESDGRSDGRGAIRRRSRAARAPGAFIMRRRSLNTMLWMAVWLSVTTAGAAHSAMAQSRSSDDLADLFEGEVFIQQPSPAPVRAPAGAGPERAEPPRPARRTTRNDYVRIARVPNMFGDSLGMGGQISFTSDETGGITNFPGTSADLPFALGRSFKIGENTRPLPTDRVFFVYNGFQNAQETITQGFGGGPPIQRRGNIDMYTLGFEKTFGDEWNSFEFRLPFLGYENMQDPGLFSPIAYDVKNFGDVSLFYKRLLYRDETTAMTAGLGLGLPTSPDVTGRISGSEFTINTDAIHLMPFIGFLTAPNDDWFFQSYLQLDFATTGNRIESESPFLPEGKLTEQNLLIVDFSAGRWLYREETDAGIRGVASVFELHYTTTLQDADIVRDSQSFFGSPRFGILGNRLDVLNATAGLHFQLTELSNLRVAGVAPLRGAFDQQFDAEIQVSFNRMF
jgi:hypothetical protein